MIYRSLVPFMVFVFLIAACSASPMTLQATSAGFPYPDSENPSEVNEYPYPMVDNPYPAQGYPAPQEELIAMATAGPIPTPATDSGVVIGALLHQGKPVFNVNLYLAEMLKNEKGEEVVASYDRTSSPRAFTNAEGNFVFANVPPGNYSLILDIIIDSLLLGHPSGSGPILITVEAGETNELGILDYSELPIPEQ